jgi:hypothetical protein
MKANKLTNSINLVINEDKFAKYTISQIYDELGPEDFTDYMDAIAKKTIKNIDGLSKAIPKEDDFSIKYAQNHIVKVDNKTQKQTWEVVITLWTTHIEILARRYDSNSILINSQFISTLFNKGQTNISEFVKNAILTLCKGVGIV